MSLTRAKANLDLQRLILNILEAVFLLSQERRCRISRRERLQRGGSLALSLMLLNDPQRDHGLIAKFYYSKLIEVRKAARMVSRSRNRRKGLAELRRILKQLKSAPLSR